MKTAENEKKEKFITLYHSYVDEIYQYIYIRIGFDQSTAEDITQEVFVSVYKGLSGFRALSSERTWIHKIARNKINDFYREQYNRSVKTVEMTENMSDWLEDPEQDLQTILLQTVEQKMVRNCLKQLSDQYRIVLVLKYMDGESVKTIARIMNKSPKAIESVLQRAKAAFAKQYVKNMQKEGM